MNKKPQLLILLILSLTLFAKERLDLNSAAARIIRFPEAPATFGAWTGVDLHLDDRVLAMLNPDQLVYRNYLNASGVEVELYGLFYSSQGRNRTMHSPMNCYPGSGWEIIDTRKAAFKGLAHPEQEIRAQRLVIRKGLAQRVLYYWYYAGERTASDQLTNKLLTLFNAVVSGRIDGGLVIVSTPTPDTHDEPKSLAEDFIPRLLDVLGQRSVGL